jgi:hypothetical protein
MGEIKKFNMRDMPNIPWVDAEIWNTMKNKLSRGLGALISSIRPIHVHSPWEVPTLINAGAGKRVLFADDFNDYPAGSDGSPNWLQIEPIDCEVTDDGKMKISNWGWYGSFRAFGMTPAQDYIFETDVLMNADFIGAGFGSADGISTLLLMFWNGTLKWAYQVQGIAGWWSPLTKSYAHILGKTYKVKIEKAFPLFKVSIDGVLIPEMQLDLVDLADGYANMIQLSVPDFAWGSGLVDNVEAYITEALPEVYQTSHLFRTGQLEHVIIKRVAETNPVELQKGVDYEEIGNDKFKVIAPFDPDTDQIICKYIPIRVKW